MPGCCGGGAQLPVGMSRSGLTWRLMAPDATDSEACAARDDAGHCLDFPSQAAAAAYRDANGVDGAPMAVLA